MKRRPRIFAVIFSLTLFAFAPGCQKPLVIDRVDVDEAAAFPEQTQGTRPPVLNAEKRLTPEELNQGYVQFFDGISTYGWTLERGNEENLIILNYAMNDGKSIQGLTAKDNCSIIHSFSDTQFDFADMGRKINQNSPSSEWFTLSYTLEKISLRSVLINANAVPNNMQPLGEADWKAATEPCESVWEDGVLTLTGGSGMVESVHEYGDFILRLEYFTEPMEPGINSGVFFRCIPGEKMNGYECQILNKASDEDYEKFIGTDTGGLFRRQVGRNVAPQDGQWNYLTIAANGPNVATWVNGIQVTDWTDTREPHQNPRNGLRLEPGTLQLQGHDPGTKIQFRNFRIANIVQNP